MVELIDLEVGFPDVEEFCLDLEAKHRSTVIGKLCEQGKSSPEWQIVRACMNLKMINEKMTNSSLESERYSTRKQIEEAYGKNSRKSRNIVKKLRCEASRTKSRLMKKHEAKMKHLRRKYRTDEEEKIDKIPDSIADLKLERLSIFNKKKYEEKKTVEYDVQIIGKVTLSYNEQQILKLPPKFAVEENLPEEGLALDEELSYAKARMTISKEEEEKLEDEGIEEDKDEEFEEELEKTEAMTRQIYNTKESRFDDRKRRVTDLKECARVTLPKPLDTKHEALIEMRRGTNQRVYNDYRKEKCNKKGEVEGNLTEEEKDGLKSLQKKIKNQEIVILKTDKSGKLCVVSWEEYIRMGREHTGRDQEIDRKTIIEKENI